MTTNLRAACEWRDPRTSEFLMAERTKQEGWERREVCTVMQLTVGKAKEQIESAFVRNWQADLGE